jgi:hypothetical protein
VPQGDENRVKHYWELFALQARLRSGEIDLGAALAPLHQTPTSCLISPDTWPTRRGDTLARSGMPATYAERLKYTREWWGLLTDDLARTRQKGPPRTTTPAR